MNLSHRSPRRSIDAGSPVVPTRSRRPSGESALRGHTPRLAPVAARVRSSWSGACARRALSSVAAAVAMVRSAWAFSVSKRRSSAARCLRPTTWLPMTLTGPSRHITNTTGLRMARKRTPPITTGNSAGSQTALREAV